MSETGDINHVSDTSLWVAVHRAREGLRTDAMYKDPLAFVLAGERGEQIAKQMAMPEFMSWMMALRTVSIDELIQMAISYGVDTVINLGAGLDTRPYRLELPASLKWIEVDFPHVVELKNSKLKHETPRVQLERVPLDLGDRGAAQDFFKRAGNASKMSLIITEGVIPYLTDEHAAHLAEDLRAIPAFRYWIQDYRRGGFQRTMPNWFSKKLKAAPFQFHAVDWFGFFAERGWHIKHDMVLEDQALRRKRRMPFNWRMLLAILLIPPSKHKLMKRATGYVLLEAQ